MPVASPSWTLLLALLSACQPDGSSDKGGTPDDTAPGTSASEGWCAVADVVRTECTVCHGTGDAALGGLDLVTDPYAALVGQASAAYAGRTLVVPGDPDGSFLYVKLQGAQMESEGTQMPPNGILDAERRELVRSWIADGASQVCSSPDSGGGGGGEDDSGGGARHHPAGFADPAQHGHAAKYQEETCVTCHGEDLSGGTAGVSCDSCHEPGWRTNCTYCHGGDENLTGAPPHDIDGASTDLSFSAHSAHVVGTLHAPFECTECHAKPTDVLSTGHFLIGDTTPGVAEVSLAGGLSAAGNYSLGSCTNLYCHGTGQGDDGSATDGTTVGCGDCHAGPSDSSQWWGMGGQHGKHMSAGFTCAECHGDTVSTDGTITGLALHVNGVKDLRLPDGIAKSGGQCTGSCHGEGHSGRWW